MPAPKIRQEAPPPHADWVGLKEVDAPSSRSLAKIAKLWRPIGTFLETAVCTLSRYSLRLIDRETGIPYSADELSAKILVDVGDQTAHTHTSADITDRTCDGATNPGKILRTSASLLEGPVGGVILSAVTLTEFGASLVQHPTSDEFYYDGQVYAQGRPLKSGAIAVLPTFADATAANAEVSIGDVWWDTTLQKARVRLS